MLQLPVPDNQTPFSTFSQKHCLFQSTDITVSGVPEEETAHYFLEPFSPPLLRISPHQFKPVFPAVLGLGVMASLMFLTNGI